jgi:hypothetical protein
MIPRHESEQLASQHEAAHISRVTGYAFMATSLRVLIALLLYCTALFSSSAISFAYCPLARRKSASRFCQVISMLSTIQ